MKDGNVEFCLESLFDFKTNWCCDVLEVNSAKTWSDGFDGGNDVVGAMDVKHDRHTVDIGKMLKQQRLAFHDWHSTFWSDISQAQNGRSVRDNGDEIVCPGVDGHK